MSLSIYGIGLVVAVIWITVMIIQKGISVHCVLRSLRNTPGRVALWVHPTSPLAFASRGYFPFKDLGCWYSQFEPFRQRGSTYLSSVTMWDSTVVHWFADPAACRAIGTQRQHFIKDVETYKVFETFGNNLVSSEGVDWKRHRSISRLAFNDANNAFVWCTTIRLMNELFTQFEQNKLDTTGSIPINSLNTFTQVALAVLISAGFGKKMSIIPSQLEPKEQSNTFEGALSHATFLMVANAGIPPQFFAFAKKFYIPAITPFLRKITASFDTIGTGIADLIDSAKASLTVEEKYGRADTLIRNLVTANVQDDKNLPMQLDDSELVSNIFVFLVAGHETTARTLTFAVLVLAIYPDIQQKIREEARRLWPNEIPTGFSLTTYRESMNALPFTCAAIYETLRCFPIGRRLCRDVVSDTTIKSRSFQPCKNGEKIKNIVEYDVHIKAGSQVLMDIYAMHMNPIFWGEDAAQYNPERFIDTETYAWPRDAFLAFGTGPRACIGEQFALTESACALAMLIRKYDILVPEALEGKTREQQEKVMLRWTPDLTTTPRAPQIRLRRRVY